MDISAVSGAIAAVSGAEGGTVQESAGIAVLKKAIDVESQSALQLIQALPQPRYNNPPGMGQGVDTFA